MTTSSFPKPRLTFLYLSSLAAALFVSSCASIPDSVSYQQNRRTPSRTELVLLNVPEGSGWVAYRKDETDENIEDYRIVVIRQSTDEIMYDSIIPLATSMETHGFELSRDDPRLQNIARNVDRNIIEPLESVMPQIQEERESIADVEEPSVISDPTQEAETVAITPPVVEESTPQAEVEFPETADPNTPFPFIQRNGDQVFIGMPKPDSLSNGDRLFVRQPDRTLSLPGDETQSVVTRGSLTGLVQVDYVRGRVATTVLLSGYLPKDPTFERIE